ncbi:G-patch RNA-binding protein, involved in splicing [Schizosaccharomyces pombe]|uniref:WHI2-like protein P4H10.16c n=1 Tax=Schizosaccharomyces pombe (strain 972 / ATCC 24843) TaxID=284812 RepID=YOFG_SCHPO|nr:putative phosphatase activator [Schizosaccharomyces pombe]Q9P7D3.1 RecName: Full=WHI2-like protein P4H10.16c [Schizosaccharomyces pombe 972h-]CAB83174.1 phosphatase activator (predicted) [Schizosaccharomyces pombe]|eukprot:NP_596190.1 putative phosphatase activator [Schizosaccharomyces pombe]
MSVITQAQEIPTVAANPDFNYEGDPIIIQLCDRDTVFELSRDQLLGLPESILMCLFPRGLLLDYEIQECQLTQRPLIFQTADFDPSLLQYILNYFQMAENRTANDEIALSPPPPSFPGKCGIILLKEDIEFFILPPISPTTNIAIEVSPNDLLKLKQRVAQRLLQQKKIFDCLHLENSTSEGSAEKNLVRMLCYSGFHEDDEWKRRIQEPHRACITSVTLTNLDFSADQGPVSDPEYFPVYHKLLLFWQKPARKCWWDSSTSITYNGIEFATWVRRVWTLELAVLGANTYETAAV